jgi:hypothetical protein
MRVERGLSCRRQSLRHGTHAAVARGAGRSGRRRPRHRGGPRQPEHRRAGRRRRQVQHRVRPRAPSWESPATATVPRASAKTPPVAVSAPASKSSGVPVCSGSVGGTKVTVGGWPAGSVKVAETERSRVMVSVQGGSTGAPAQSPPHPPRSAPATGSARSVTRVPMENMASQVEPQSMPAGTLSTVPPPLTETRGRKVAGLGLGEGPDPGVGVATTVKPTGSRTIRTPRPVARSRCTRRGGRARCTATVRAASGPWSTSPGQRPCRAPRTPVPGELDGAAAALQRRDREPDRHRGGRGSPPGGRAGDGGGVGGGGGGQRPQGGWRHGQGEDRHPTLPSERPGARPARGPVRVGVEPRHPPSFGSRDNDGRIEGRRVCARRYRSSEPCRRLSWPYRQQTLVEPRPGVKRYERPFVRSSRARASRPYQLSARASRPSLSGV